MPRFLAFCAAIALVIAGAVLGQGSSSERLWRPVTPGVWMTRTEPHGYAVVDGGQAILVDLPDVAPLEGIGETGARSVLAVLLTHHHRWTAAGALAAARLGIPVYGPAEEAPFLTVDGVEQYWSNNVPLRTSRVAHLVLARGIPGVRATVREGQVWTLGPFRIRAVETPGHSFGHVAYSVRRGEGAPVLLVGGLLAGRGTVPFPYTLEWDHWTDSGLQAQLSSLRKVAALNPVLVAPAYGEPIREDVAGVLAATVENTEAVAFLKSFERYSDRIAKTPEYRFLAEEQVATAGQKPFSRLSEHLYVTGNTYLLVSRSGATLAVDLWGQRSVERVRELVRERGWQMPEVVLISHAHYDHYDGIYELPNREQVEVWTLDRVADVVTQPGRYRHPFTDPRPVKVDRILRDGEELTWREYRFRVFHFPGQTEFTMGVETWIDGRHCVFTADNFFHKRQFSGSGGWTGLNRALPDGYHASAERVLKLGPAWILAEHGGPFEFDREDFRRRAAWARDAAAACDRLSMSGDRFVDWDLHGLACEPVLLRARPGDEIAVRLMARRTWSERVQVVVDPSAAEDVVQLDLALSKDGGELRLRLDRQVPDRRVAVPFRVYENGRPAAPDMFLVVETVN